MTLDQIREALKGRNLMYVSKETDIHHQTLYNIRNGRTSEAKRRTLRVLSEYLQRQVTQ